MCTSMTSTRSKVKVKVMQLLKFQKWHFPRSISSAILAWSSKLMVDFDSMGPKLQLVRALLCSFLLRKLSCDFKLHGMSILPKGHISMLLEARVTWSYMLVVSYVLCMLIWPWPDPKWRSQGFRSSENCTFQSLSPPIWRAAPNFGRFLNFSPSWWSCDFKIRKMLISPQSSGSYLHAAWG